jgi:hypothetical protein
LYRLAEALRVEGSASQEVKAGGLLHALADARRTDLSLRATQLEALFMCGLSVMGADGGLPLPALASLLQIVDPHSPADLKACTPTPPPPTDPPTPTPHSLTRILSRRAQRRVLARAATLPY